jgi:phage terminase large subunit-like protein
LPTATRNSFKRSGRATADFPTYGPLAVAWIEANVVHGEGDLFGQPFRCTDDQRQFLDKLLIYNPDTGRLIVQRAVLGRAKGWGKTEFIAAVVLFFLCGPIAPLAPNIPIAAASFEQADLLFGSARIMVKEGPLSPFLDVFDTEILIKEGQGRAFRVAAAAGTNDGGRPTLFAADELHEWTGSKARVFLVISNSIAKRKDGLVLVISTAGSPESELLRGLYDYGRQVEEGLIDDPAFLMDWAEADADLDPHDGAEVRAEMARQGNPHAEQFGTLPFIERRWHEVPEHEWRRYFANQWWERPLDSWLPLGAWAACEGTPTLDGDRPTFVGVDMALKHDSVAVVAVQVDEDGNAHTSSRIWFPDGTKIDVAAVENHLRDLHRHHNLSAVAYDPAFFERSAQALEDDGLPMVEFPQSPQRMVPACQVAYEMINAQRVIHDGSPAFTDQVLSAAIRETDGGWRLSKGKSKRKVDAAIALVMALSVGTARPAQTPTVDRTVYRF